MPELGLVCQTASDEVRFRTITRTRLLALTGKQRNAKLRELYAANIERLNLAIDFCSRIGVRLYRMPSQLFPFADSPYGYDLLDEFADQLQKTGKRIQATPIRVVSHPDQFVVLSSENEKVISNSIHILKMQARVFDYLLLPRSEWSVIQLHGGKSGRIQKLIDVIKTLPAGISNRLALENDEFAYSAAEIYEVCRSAKIPMVFDAHHHLVHEELDSYDHPSVKEATDLARSTWKNPKLQLVHISNGKTKTSDPRHSDFITRLPSCFQEVAWIEVEAKAKEEAIFQLQKNWMPKINQDERTRRSPEEIQRFPS